MGGKRRNRNKINRDDLAITSSAHRKQNAALEVDDQSDVESVDTHMTFDDGTTSIMDDDDMEEESEPFSLSDRLEEFLDNASHKNISIRMAALQNIKNILSKYYMSDELENSKTALMDLIEKNLRRTDEEALCAASIAAVTAVQLGNIISDEIEQLVVFLQQICSDPSRLEILRAQCASSLALCSYLCLEHPDAVACSTSTLRSIWTTTKTNCQSSTLFSAALYGWALLIHEANRSVLETALLDQPKLCSFVDGVQVDMRVSAGEVLAVLHESATGSLGDGYRFPNQQHLLEILATLATDSVKFRGKKDRRMQRSSFRQIYNAISDNEAPSYDIKFGSEALHLETCGSKLIYDQLCGALNGGMLAHLRTNALLREIFELGPVCTDQLIKETKKQRRVTQNAINKSRDQQRAKQRGKRAC